MAQQLTLYPQLPASRQTVTLGGERFQLRFVWKERMSCWYMDVRTQTGGPLALGLRVSPLWSPLLGLKPEGGPTGHFYVRGHDGYAREDLGDTLLIRYYEESEIPDTSVDLGVSVVLAP